MEFVKLTDEQQNAVNYVQKHLKHKRFIAIGGYAGTGKSTCLTELIKLYPKFLICAFTGKASNVLRKKGLNAQTIHSTIYNCEKHGDTFYFRLKTPAQLHGATGFFVDEASMVNKDLLKDLESFGLPIVFLGDHGQLEPVGGYSNIMQNPDVTLETIHRNANSIARFADFLRQGNSAINWQSDDNVKLISKKSLTPDHMLMFDQIICGFNKTRLSVNNHMRQIYRFDGKPQKNERIICLKNNKNHMVYNGMQGKINSIHGKILTFTTDEGRTISLPIDLNQFSKEKLLESAEHERNIGFFDFAYCITCHKAQGDEWDNVLVLEEKTKLWDYTRWAYTAASRARNLLYWAV